jgi:hypothetical protein
LGWMTIVAYGAAFITYTVVRMTTGVH